MKIHLDSLKPVYMQIAEAIEDDIINGKLAEGEAAYSQLVIARALNVNPATAAKGLQVLVKRGLLERQRGASMVVTQGARAFLLHERRGKSFNQHIAVLVAEAQKVGLSEQEVITAIQQYYQNQQNQQNQQNMEAKPNAKRKHSGADNAPDQIF